MKLHHKDTKGTKLKPIDTGDPNRHVFAQIRVHSWFEIWFRLSVLCVFVVN
jgi:hypothetical protein